MKKILLYIFLLLIICFILPALCSNGAKTVFSSININKNKEISDVDTKENELKKGNEENEIQENQEYVYEKYGSVRLLHTDTGQIETLPIDEYLCNVVSAEMPADFEIEALKAQAIVARTYTIYQMINNNQKHENADVCDSSSCCQAWITKEYRFSRWDESVQESNWAKIEEAVNSTKGKIITFDGMPINAFFHSNSGGATESSVNIWGGIEYPYLQTVETAGEDGYTQYASEVVLTNDELLSKIKEKYPNVSIDFTAEDAIKIIEYNSSGRVKTLKLGNTQISGVEARTIFGLRSANFEIIREDGKVKFSVKGYGHGVGMSQTGADSMAKTRK